MVSLPEKMIRKCFGGKGRSTEEKKLILRKRCKARSLGIMCRKYGVCVDRCMCTRIHGGKKVICKK